MAGILGVAMESLERLEAKSICVVGERHAAPLVTAEEDFYDVDVNSASKSNVSGFFYGHAIASFANIYIAAKFAGLDLTASVVCPVPKDIESSNVAYYCVVIEGDDWNDKLEELIEVANLIRQKITPQPEITDKESKLDISCLDDAIASFLNKNSLRRINSRFSVGNCFDLSKQIPIRMYGLGIKNSKDNIVRTGYAIQNGYNEIESTIFLLACSEESPECQNKIEVKILNQHFINTVIKSREKGELLIFAASKEKSSKFYILKSLELSGIKIGTDFNSNQKDKLTSDLELN